MTKKAQGLPLNTIILALLSLAVMVLVFAAMTGRLGAITRASTECPGRCAPYQTLPSSYTAESREGCVSDIEAEQSGTFIERVKEGTPRKCQSCCLRQV